jgi:Tfp pilus assembly protein PilZ
MMQASTEQAELDREPRIDLATDVRILTSGQSNTIQASTQNISESGMFVVTEDVCSVNAELVCDVSLPNLNLPVRGRVVWVQTAPRPGMGIEFLDLNEADLTALREVVATQVADQPGQPVKVWMEALPQPIRAEAVQTGHGVLLRSELSFLKLASPVLVYPADADQQQSGESYSGVLEEVSLTMNSAGTAPVLLLHMHFTPQESVEPAGSVESVELVEPAEEDLSEIPVEVDSERFGEDRICKPVEPEPKVEVAAVAEPKVVLGDPELQGDEPSWELGLESDPCARSYWSLEGPEDVEVRPPRRRHPWLWSATLLMAGLAVASMAYTDLFPRARQKAMTWLAYAGLAEGSAAVEAPQAQAPQAQAPQVSASEVPAPTNDDLELTAPPAPAAKPPAVATVSGLGNYKIVTGAQGDKELVVLLKGSTKEGKSYRLGNPDGVAFNLPSARPQARYGSHRLDRSSAFRRVQIRPRSGGTQVRVLFWGNAPPYEVKVLPRQIRVTLLPDTRQAKGPSATAM